MTREEAKQIFPVIQAYIEGKQIQQLSNKWKDVNELSINCLLTNPELYRIKPEPKYYPFANAEECWNEMKKHQPFGWVKDNKDGHYALVTSVLTDEREVYIDGISGLNLCTAINYYTFADDTPFGVKVEE